MTIRLASEFEGQGPTQEAAERASLLNMFRAASLVIVVLPDGRRIALDPVMLVALFDDAKEPA